jgi:superfamily II DNA or RNA helicase
VKERHEILTRFREGEYKSLVASHVLNEGVDVPDARVAIILSGTGSNREYIQRLGRVLRKGNDDNKLALLYEVVAEDTSEEGVSLRRHGSEVRNEPPRGGGRKEVEKPKLKHQQLEFLPTPSIYEVSQKTSPKAAESSPKWGEEDEFDV